MVKVCKRCKIKTDRDYCRICGSHDLVDLDNRYFVREINIKAILYDTTRRMFCVETDDGETYPVTSSTELKNIGYGDMQSILNKIKHMDGIRQREYNEELFGGDVITISVKIDMLFDMIVEIYSQAVKVVDVKHVLSRLANNFEVVKSPYKDRYIVGNGQVRVAIDNMERRNKKSVFIYPIVFIGESWLVIYDKRYGMKTIRKSGPHVENKIIHEVTELNRRAYDVVDGLFKDAKETLVDMNKIEYIFDVMKHGGRVSGYVMSNIMDMITDDMTVYDVVMMLLDAMLYTNGVTVKEYIAKQAGRVLIGKC